MKTQNIALILAATLTLTSCAGSPSYIEPRLPIPERPVLPEIKDKDLSCLPDQVYGDLAIRDYLWKKHAEKMETILRTTRNE